MLELRVDVKRLCDKLITRFWVKGLWTLRASIRSLNGTTVKNVITEYFNLPNKKRIKNSLS